jgi:hypothetical protein
VQRLESTLRITFFTALLNSDRHGSREAHQDEDYKGVA